LRARQVLHDDCTWKYATCFRHGLTALSLERSLVLAGESPEEYRAHLARFDRLVLGLEPRTQSDPAKLARATASSPGGGCAPCASTASGPCGH